MLVASALLWLPLLYFILLTSTRGQTPGKKGTGIKVVRSDGLTPSFGYVVLRETTKLAPVYVLIGFSWLIGDPRLLPLAGVPLLLGFTMVSRDPKRQGWHDKIAGTYIVKTKEGS